MVDVENGHTEIAGQQTMYRLDLAGVYVDIEVPSDWGETLPIPDTLTGFRGVEVVSPGIHEENRPPKVKFGGESRFSVDIDSDGDVTVTGPAKHFASKPELAFIAQALSERSRQEKGGALVHAAAVASPDGKEAFLILGEKGSGKTLTTLELGMRGYRFIGNDQVILEKGNGSELNLVDGSKYFMIRKTAADLALGSLLSILQVTGEPAWNTKAKILPSELGIETVDHPVPIIGVFQVQIDHVSQPEPVIEWESNALQTQLFLAEKMTRHISGGATPVMNEDGAIGTLLPSFDTPLAREKRLQLISNLQSKRYIRIFAADAPTIADIIESV